MSGTNGSHYNGGSEDNGENEDNDPESESGKGNVIHIPTLAERDRIRRNHTNEDRKIRSPEKPAPKPQGNEPFFSFMKSNTASRHPHTKEPLLNIPPVTKYLLLSLLTVHLVVFFFLDRGQYQWALMHFAFIPGTYTGAYEWGVQAFLGPFTHMWLHGGWLHFLMNAAMLLAFGTGVERWLGGKRLIMLYILCGVFGVLTHFIFHPFSVIPVIGASGGISGLFAAILVMMHKSGMSGSMGRHGIMPFIILWVVISVALGFVSGPGGSTVAWAAHVGGFLGGFLLLSPMLRR